MLIVRNVEQKLEKAIFDGIRGDVQLRHFILLCPNFSTTSQTYLSLLL